MKVRKAIVFGATGLIGKAVTNELVKSDTYDQVTIFVRSRTNFSHEDKVREFVVDFDDPAGFSDYITGDDLYICLGTTIKKAGSIRRMEEIDRDLPVKIATIAQMNGVSRLAVVSSVGANANSSGYYLRIKGEMENRILELSFETIAVVRPSILLGERKEFRFGEEIGRVVIKSLGPLLSGNFKKYRGIKGENVAKAMVTILRDDRGKKIYESDQLHKISEGAYYV